MPAETRATDDDTIIGIDLGTTNSEVAIVSGGKPSIVEEGGEAILPSCVGLDAAGRRHRRTPGPQPGRGRPGTDRALGQAPHGLRDAGADGQGRLHPAGDFGLHSQGAQGTGGPRARPGRAQGGHHRPGVLHRHPAPGDARSRGDRRPDGRADHQRTDGRRAQLRVRRRGGPHPPRLRPGRRDLRRLRGANRTRRGRSAGHRRRTTSSRRRLRRARPRTPEHARRDGAGGRERP